MVFGIIATCFLHLGISFAAKKLMSAFTILSGLNGALGLYSGVKGLFGAADARDKQKALLKRAAAVEDSWYRRNYFGDFLNNSSARAAIKRVEKTLSRQNKQNRAYAAINGATPEYSIASNQQGLHTMENLMTNLAAQDDARKQNIDAVHRNNKQALMNSELSNLSMDERMAAQSASNVFNLLEDALMGINWGREDDK